jgi:hypothetical protein
MPKSKRRRKVRRNRSRGARPGVIAVWLLVAIAAAATVVLVQTGTTWLTSFPTGGAR